MSHRDPVIAQLLWPGDVAGAGRLLRPGSVHESTARALLATEVLVFTWSDAVSSGKVPEVLRVLGAAQSVQLEAVCDRLAEAAHLPAAARVASAVLRLTPRHQRVEVNQGTVATVAGVVRATANAELRELVQLGTIRCGRRSIEVVDRRELERRSRAAAVQR